MLGWRRLPEPDRPYILLPNAVETSHLQAGPSPSSSTRPTQPLSVSRQQQLPLAEEGSRRPPSLPLQFWAAWWQWVSLSDSSLPVALDALFAVHQAKSLWQQAVGEPTCYAPSPASFLCGIAYDMRLFFVWYSIRHAALLPLKHDEHFGHRLSVLCTSGCSSLPVAFVRGWQCAALHLFGACKAQTSDAREVQRQLASACRPGPGSAAVQAPQAAQAGCCPEGPA